MTDSAEITARLNAARHARLTAIEDDLRAEAANAAAWERHLSGRGDGLPANDPLYIAWQERAYASERTLARLATAAADHKATFLAAGCPPTPAPVRTLDGTAPGYDVLEYPACKICGTALDNPANDHTACRAAMASQCGDCGIPLAAGAGPFCPHCVQERG